MVDAIVSFAVQKLGDFLIQEVVFLRGVEEDVKWLKDELGYMQSFIKDAEEKQGGDHRVQQWISDISDVANDTPGVLETFTLKIQGGEDRGARKQGIVDYILTHACICNKQADLYDIGKEIESLKKRVLEISRRRETYGIKNISNTDDGTSGGSNNKQLARIALRRATSHVEGIVIGLEDDADTLLAQLLKKEPRFCVISIYGMGGLGKTTLARKLYHSDQVSLLFKHRAWVCVSQEYRPLGDLLQSIIKSFKREIADEELQMLLKMLRKMTVEDLEAYLRNYLRGYRYLVVVDDLWDKTAWESLRRALPDNKNGSRVIITTRNKDIAMQAYELSFVHELRFLRSEESWKLFCKKAFPKDGEVGYCPPAMEKLGREMVEKCRGLPLAIIVLGGLLSFQKGVEEWQKVREHIWLHLKDYSMEIDELLSLSYNDLSPQLKDCFLYLAIFPEDYVFHAEKLTWLWMAEELIPQGEQRMEDVAHDYLDELINRNLVQVAERFWGKIVGCRVHDLLRDLAVQKAMEVKKLNFNIYDPRKYPTSTPSPSCQRLSIHTQLEKYFSLGLSHSQLRSLTFVNPHLEQPKMDCFKFICKQFKQLGVLDLENVHFDLPILPGEIGELSHLKFLGLMNTNICELPPSIGNLRSLQTIEASGILDLTLPREVGKLKQLRHIFACIKGSLQINALENLQTLRYIHYDQWIDIDTTNLTSLKELMITSIGKACSLDPLAKLKSLRTLILHSDDTFPSLQPLSRCPYLVKLWLDGKIERLQTLEELPKSLTMLILMESELMEDPMSILERLPNLRSLELKDSYHGKKIVCSSSGFCQLEFLLLDDLSMLEEWQVEKGAMPLIKGLAINKCNELAIPARLRAVPAVPVPERNYHITYLRRSYYNW